jgi:iron complex outermembrane receptor protein
MTPSNRFSLISLMALGLAMPAFAQAPAAQPATGPQQDERDSRDVIVVTAQKREETVQDIAVAVTAISSELRDEIGLTTVQDYTNFAPGLSYSSANDRLGMRGVTRTSNNFGIRSGISNYVDGVYYSSAIPASREPIFVQRVEVLRGPQGTLYGRDSIGGALNVIMKRPEDTFGGQFNIGFGNFDSRKLEARLTGPLTDNIRWSLQGSRTYQGEGPLINVAGLESEANKRDDYYWDAQLEGNIGENFEWWARYGQLNWDVRAGLPGGRTSAGDRQPYDTRLFGAPGGISPNSFFGFSPVAQNVVQLGTQRTNPNIGQSQTLKFNADFTQFAHLSPTTEGALEMVYHAPQFDIKYLGGYVHYHYNLQIDNDGGPVSQFSLPFALSAGVPANTPLSVARVTDYNEKRAWFSNEINLVSTGDGPFQWVTGLYQYQENYTQPIYVTSYPETNAPIFRFADVLAGNFTNPVVDLPDLTGRTARSGSPLDGDLWYFSNNQGNNHAYGVFFQGDYSFNDQWKVTGGLRWSKDVMNGADQVRFISHYALGLTRVDGTASFFGGADPTTITPSNPCGLAGKGILNTNVTAANGNPATGCGGANDRSRYGIYIDPATGIARRTLAAGWHEVTGVAGLEWTPDTDTLIYGKYNRGYKPGGLGCADTNCNLTSTPYTDKELVDAVALGLKRDWRAANLTTNAELYYYDYAGYQVSNTIVPDPDANGVRPPAYVAYVNLPTTKTTGFELETIWRPIDPLRILFNYGYTNPEIGDSPSLVHAADPFAQDPDAQPLGAPVALSAALAAVCPISKGGTQPNNPTTLALPNCSRIQGQNLKGNILPFSPKNKAALIGTYTFDYADGSSLSLTANYSWQDVAFSSVFNRWLSKIPSWDQTNFRAQWTNGDGNITLIGFVNNVFDEVVFDSRGGGRRIGNVVRDAPLELCGSSARTQVIHTGTLPNGAPASPLGSLFQDCSVVVDTYRPPRVWGAELQFRF